MDDGLVRVDRRARRALDGHVGHVHQVIVVAVPDQDRGDVGHVREVPLDALGVGCDRDSAGAEETGVRKQRSGEHGLVALPEQPPADTQKHDLDRLVGVSAAPDRNVPPRERLVGKLLHTASGEHRRPRQQQGKRAEPPPHPRASSAHGLVRGAGVVWPKSLGIRAPLQRTSATPHIVRARVTSPPRRSRSARRPRGTLRRAAA